jgi:enoyl-CoA hydratase/carnithine racemase
MAMTEPLVSVEIETGVAVLELRRPERRNAVSPALADELERAAALLSLDEAVRVVVLAGSGPSFCAGADMTERLAGPQGSAAVLDAVRRSSRAVHSIAVPVVAALHGHALGAGLELAAMADYRVAERSTVLGIPEVHQGITSGGGILALASLIGRGRLARLAFAGARVDGAEAHALGIVDEVVEADARGRALETAREFAAGPRPALVATKRALRVAVEPRFEQQWDHLGLLQQTMEGGRAQREALDRLRADRSARQRLER